jgi:uncharacterized membrane protein
MSLKSNFSWKKNPLIAALNWVGVIALICGIVYWKLATAIIGIALFVAAYLVKASKNQENAEEEIVKKKKR